MKTSAKPKRIRKRLSRVSRRQFLRSTAAAAAALSLRGIWLPRGAAAQTAGGPAFIGAQGYGAQANGWRSPSAKILFVENLNNSGPGSFRQAYQFESGPRYIIFRVGGYIPCFGYSYLENSHAGGGSVYVAGQTAPGDGITFKGESNNSMHYDGFYVRNAHCCIRHVRSRCHSASDNTWAFALWGCSYTIIDHCSASWATDDQCMIQTTAGMVTVQNCLFAEPKAYSLTMNDNHGHVSVHHNYLGLGHQRNPLANPGQASQFINNLLYNWGGYSGKCMEVLNYYGLTPPPTYDILHNVFRWGPYSGYIQTAGWDNPLYGKEILLSKGPMMIHHANSNRAWLPASAGGYVPARIDPAAGGTITISASKVAAPAIPVTVDDVATQAQGEAWARALLAKIGCTRPRRDAYDAFQVSMFEQFKAWKVPPYGTEFISPFTIANGGNPWPALASGTPEHLQPSGMTQEFINRMGLQNTTASALSTSISQARGLGETYQNIEWCLMEKAGDIAPLGSGTPPPPADTLAPARPKNLRVKP